MTKKRLEIVLLVLIALTLAFIWGNSMLDRAASTEVSSGLLELLRPVLSFFGIDTDSDHWLRKLAHFCEFGLLGAELCCLSILGGCYSAKHSAVCAVTALAVACVDEGIQFFSGRYPSLRDVLLDFSGSLCGIAAVGLIFAIVVKKQNKSSDE